ncbi:MAG: hypothetical protein ACPG6I_06335, partial [Flavobacteriaceae bacterium]
KCVYAKSVSRVRIPSSLLIFIYVSKTQIFWTFNHFICCPLKLMPWQFAEVLLIMGISSLEAYFLIKVFK